MDVFSTPSQLDGDLVTLTLLPRSRWQALLNLDVIQVCAMDRADGKVVLNSLEPSNEINPRNPLKGPNRPPSSFRLYLLSNIGLELTRNKPKTRKRPGSTKLWQAPKVYSIKNSQNYRRKADVGIGHILLLQCSQPFAADDDLFDYIKSLSPAAIDIELRSLVTLSHHRQFLHALKRRLLSHKDFEAVQTLENVFLRLHGDVLIENAELRSELEELLELQKKESDRILALLSSSLGTLAFVRDTM